jgi:tetratricopeptide (TPR) repeat protein
LYDKAIALRPESVHARFNRMILYKMAGAHRAVVTEADALLALDNPELDTLYTTLQKKRMSYRTQTRLERALIWETMGQTETAAKAFADWIAVEPNAVSYGYRAAFHERHEHYPEALADLDKAIADDPEFWLLHHTQARVFYYTQRDEDAVRAETRAVALNPEAGVSYWLRAMSERRLGRADAALRDGLKAVAVDRGVLALKIETLSKLGYLRIGPNDKKDPLPAVAEAVQACMLDEECW